MKKVIILIVVSFAIMEGVSWWAYKTFSRENAASGSEQEQKNVSKEGQKAVVDVKNEEVSLSVSDGADAAQEKPAPESEPQPTNATSAGYDPASFPPPSTQVVGGRTERTIHMGVRQYVWDPATIRAKEGELVRLVIHNADVKHGLVIPDLGVNEDIPPEGAIVEFVAKKKGTFRSFCSVYCGEGHMEMQGTLVVE